MILVTAICPINYTYKHTHSCIHTGMRRIRRFGQRRTAYTTVVP